VHLLSRARRTVGSIVAATLAIVAVATAAAPAQASTVDGGGPVVLRGADVSSYQGCGINWNTVAAGGVDFAIAKAIEGSYYTDPCYAHNHAGAVAAGLVFGAYDFANTCTDPVYEADRFLGVAQLRAGEIPILDVELDQCGLGSLRGWVEHWAAEIRAHGFRAVLYSYRSFLSGHGISSDAALAGFPLWLAQYGGSFPLNIGVWPRPVMWQYADNACTGGIGCVDGDYFYGTVADLRSLSALGAALPDLPRGTTPAPPVSAPSAPSPGGVYVVRGGDTLAAIAARYHTTVAVLARLNGIRNVNLIFVGQRLRLPGGPAAPAPAAPAVSGSLYVVRRGDTLGAIASRFHTSVSWLASRNHIRDANLIFVGQVLVV
jgi:lysozyme